MRHIVLHNFDLDMSPVALETYLLSRPLVTTFFWLPRMRATKFDFHTGGKEFLELKAEQLSFRAQKALCCSASVD